MATRPVVAPVLRPVKRQLTERVWQSLKIEPNEQIARAAKSVLLTKEDIEIFHTPDVGATPYMLHPNCLFRRVWDVCTACFVVCVCLITPMELGFQSMDWRWLGSFETFLDVFFVTDMVLSFRTGFHVSGEIVMSPRLVMWHYAETWLIVDCVSNFPFYLFYPHANQSSVKFLKLQKIPKMLRFARLLKYMRQYAKYFNFVLVVVAMLMSLHVLTCLWASLFDECVHDVFDAAANTTFCNGDQMQPMYLESLMTVLLLYVSLAEYSTYASIGNLGSPATRATSTVYLLSICIVISGIVSIAIFLANIISIFMRHASVGVDGSWGRSWDQQSSLFRNRMDIINAEMKHYDIPLELQHLQRRVKKNYDYLWINQRAYSEMTLLSQRGISRTLRTTIALYLYKDLLETVPFFSGEDAKLLGRICLVLETAVFLPGDLIIQVNDLGKEMFIVRRGVVQILLPSRPESEPRILLKDGAFFGETALVVEVRRTTSVQSVTITDLNVLNKQAFDEIIAEFPAFFVKMKRIVIQRQMDNMNITSDADKVEIERELNAVVEQSLSKRATDTTSAYWRFSEANKTGNKLKRIADRIKTAQTVAAPRGKRLKKSSLRTAKRSLGFASAALNAVKENSTPPVASRASSLSRPVSAQPLPTLAILADPEPTRPSTADAYANVASLAEGAPTNSPFDCNSPPTQPTTTARPEPDLDALTARLELMEASVAALPKYLQALQNAVERLQVDISALKSATTDSKNYDFKRQGAWLDLATMDNKVAPSGVTPEWDPTDAGPEKERAKALWQRVVSLTLPSVEVEKIDIYHHNTPKQVFMVHPNSKFRRMWDFCVAAAVVYVCVMTPAALGFDFVDWGTNLSKFESVLDACFIIDMVLSFRTGYFANGELHMDAHLVARHYLQSWFIIDLVSNFPLSLVLPSSNKQQKSVKILKLQKIPKLLRFGVLLKYMRQYAKYYHLLVASVTMFLGLHIFTCVWVNVYNNCDGNGTLCSDWATATDLYAESFHNVLLTYLGIAEASSYPSTSLLASPFDGFRPQMYTLSSFIAIFGVFNCALMFGHMLTLLLSWDQQSSTFRNRMDVISSEMKYYDLPADLQHRVKRNYDYLWINQRAYNDMTLLNQPGLSKPLRTTIALHLYKDLLNTVPIFAGSDARFLGKVCMALNTAVYLPADVIIHQDDIGREMFIVRKGQVEVLPPRTKVGPVHPIMLKLRSATDTKRILLKDGDFFGETALVADVRRTNTVVADTICDLNVLSKHAFNEILAEYPEFGVKMKKSVVTRQLANMNFRSSTVKRKVETQLNHLVDKSLNRRRFDMSFKGIYRAKKMADKLQAIQERVRKAETRPRRSIMQGFMARKDSIVQLLSRKGAVLKPSKSGHHIVEQTTPAVVPVAEDDQHLASFASDGYPEKDTVPMALLEINKMVMDIKIAMDKVQRKIAQR
ncbi:Voltage-gated Ion Channel (VIC) Superfamily [Achlya hypogyna]|uniref:Voltage-gated Ion Channel (VIC) Superfamily n=1 Tax=Achlya hypogyna TaxID=1202772 RepID=A0A1V9YB20_ACHHY|nr:Voltage-gated Ion Channel (VIC) Superfamily [Achlya hypogyna]